MLKLKTTVAACLALAVIGSIIACSSQPAKSGNDANVGSSPGAVGTTANPAAAGPTPSANQLAKADGARP